MKIRASQLVLLLLLAIGVFVVFAIVYANRPRVEVVADNEDFLAQIGELRNEAESSTEGLLPGSEESQDMVPVLEFETENMKLGVVPNDHISSHKLKFFNRGKRALIIKDIQTSCLCTMGKIAPENNNVPGGGESWIDVTLEPSRVPGFHSHKVLTITSNDPLRTQVQIQVEADVEPEFSVDQDEFNFGEVAKGETPSMTTRIRQVQEKPLQMTGVEEVGEAGQDLLEESINPVPESEWKTPGKAEWDLTVKLTPTLPEGDLMKYVNVATNIERLPHYPYPIRAHISSPYKMSPAYPIKVVAEPGQPGVATLTATEPVAVSDIQSRDKVLSLEAVPGANPNTLTLQVTVPEGLGLGTYDDEFTFNVSIGGKMIAEKLAARAHVRNPADPASAPAPAETPQ